MNWPSTPETIPPGVGRAAAARPTVTSTDRCHYCLRIERRHEVELTRRREEAIWMVVSQGQEGQRGEVVFGETVRDQTAELVPAGMEGQQVGGSQDGIRNRPGELVVSQPERA